MAYTDIDKPGDYFNTVLYTGTGSSLSISSLNFSPDFTWIKGRSGATEHVLTDSVRGVTKEISSNDNGAEETVAQGLTAFNSDGFTVGTDGSYNTSSATYVGWSWLGGGTASSNTDGSITSTVSANTTSGFSIVTYTGTGSAGTVGHGLNNAPEMIILKRRDGTVGNTNWFVGHKDLTSWGYRVFLNADVAEAADSDFLANTPPTSNHFSVSTDVSTNGSSGSQLAYCFHSVKGFSKFGSYTGNGSTDGTFVYTGFKPAFVITKRTDSAENWDMLDNKRNTYNVSDKLLKPNLSNAEVTFSTLDMLSNGFKLKNSDAEFNASGGTYIYMALAENPFVTSTGIPTTAR